MSHPSAPTSDPSPNPSPNSTPSDPSASNPVASTSIGLLAVTGLLLRNATDEQFSTISNAWLDQFDPQDFAGRLHAEAVLLAAARLRKAAQLEPQDTIPGLDWCRYQGMVERNYRNACQELRRHLAQKAAESAPAPSSLSTTPRTSSKARGGKAPATPDADPNPEAPPPPESTPEEIDEAFTNWRRHIALVPSKSDEWPIILRVGREVEDVAAWLADGKTEDELLTWYPELSRADIAACRGCDADGLCGPFDPADGPYPPGLPVLDDLPDDPGLE